ncbi:MAG TPA: PIN domain-containing protein [Thermoanaerobaculia bacterium]|nr:PIN domain-containing protein [Thermoanaerobaculia bacterium]
MRVLFDTNVILDVLLDRQPFRTSAAQLFARVERREIVGFLGATTLTTIHYLVSKASGKQQARAAVQNLLKLFQVAPVDHAVLESASESSIDDFEDAVLHDAGRALRVDALLTRNGGDFTKGSLLILSPQELQQTLDSPRGN